MIGQSPLRWDAMVKAEGSFVYPSDLAFPGMLHVRVVRAMRPHAKILSIDTATARRSPGVACVLTHTDIPGLNAFGLIKADQPVLCGAVVRYAGDAVAVVAAETEEQARAACDLVSIEYQDLPAVLNPAHSLLPGSPRIHKGGNLCSRVELGFGDVDSAMARSDAVVRITYTTGRQEHAYLEPEAGVAYFDDCGRLCVVCGGQNPFADQRQLAAILNLPLDKVWVSHPPMGGAFGGKEDLNVQAFIALVTMATKRPARMVYDRQESIGYSVKRHSFDVDVEVGATAEGVLTAFRATLIADTGAYMTLGPGVLVLAAEHAAGPYRFMASKIEGSVVYTNTCNASAFRGFGNPQVVIGIEQAMDELASKLGLDPIAFRCRNLLKKGDLAGPGHTMRADTSLAKLAERAAKSKLLTASTDSSGTRSATGLAFVWQGFGLGAGTEPGSTVKLTREEDGTFTLNLSQPDLGQGNLSAFLQIAASDLGCAIGDVRLDHGTTDHANAWSTNASRSVAVTGSAVRSAAKAMRMRIEKGDNGVLEETGYFRPDMDDAIEIGLPHVGYAYGIQIVRLQLDGTTGLVTIREAETYLDPGTVINPAGVEGQIEGGFAQGLGYALTEDLALSGGRVLNNRFSSYIIPTIRDVPARLRTIAVSTPEPSNPLGARGIAEIGLTPVAAAVANALAKITGNRFSRFPITPERIIEAEVSE